MATRASDIYIPTADDVLTMSETGSTAYEIVMLSLSGVIVLITGIAVLTTILRKYWKKNRLLEEPSTIEVVVESYSHERNRCNGTSPPDPSGQPHSSCTCEAVGETCPKKHEHRDASLSHPVACFINDVHITIRQT